MKIKNLVLGMMTCAALAACSNEDLVDNPSLNGKDAYVAFTISAGGNLSRATGDVVAGDENENNVAKALFVFYDAAGNYITSGAPLAGEDLQFDANGKSNAVLVLDDLSRTPSSVVTILNIPNGIQVSGKSLTALQAEISAVATGIDGAAKGTFVMSNSVYFDASGKIQVGAPIGVNNIASSKDDARLNPVSVVVERVVSKVTVGEKDGGIAIESSTIKIDGVDVVVTPVVKGWKVSGINQTSYLLKNVEQTWTGWNWANGSQRSFWAKDTNYASWTTSGSQTSDLKFFTYNDVTDKAAATYCLENTMNSADGMVNKEVAYTHLLLTAQLQDNQKVPVTIYQYKGSNMSKDGYKNVVLQVLKDNNIFVKSSETVYDNLAIGQLDIVSVNPTTYPVKPVVAQSVKDKLVKKTGNAGIAADYVAVTEADVNAIIAGMVASAYEDGMCYYYVPINHLAGKGAIGAVGVVRNHVYKMTVNSIKNLGTPVYNPEQEIVPEKPANEEFYVAAEVQILGWKVVEQGVAFD